MVNVQSFKNMSMSFPGTKELPHFEKTSFRHNNKIFVTLDIPLQRVCVKLTPLDQSVFCLVDSSVIYPVNNKWGKQGWTFVELKKVNKNLLKDVLSKAYLGVTTKDKM